MTDNVIILRASGDPDMYVARIEFSREREEEIVQRLKQAGFEVEISVTPNW
jgi:hypothetical protein